MKHPHIAVIDIGKTNAKVALVHANTLSERDVVTQPNIVRPGPPYSHYDVESLWAFICEALADFHDRHGIGAISITTHGASGALIAADGTLAAPILDYEHHGPHSRAVAYDELRPPFSETGSPRLLMGLNLGAQIDWQFDQDPGLRDRTECVVALPQYWAHRLTGVLASDLSSLGCHTDLWNPYEGKYSSLVDRLGLSGKMAPARRPTDVLGHILPVIARRTGLDPQTPVACGIHDSNASLLPHINQQSGPFSVVSSGTWVIVMTVGGRAVQLDPARDTLVNVNALGEPIFSARFMGGREFEILMQGRAAECEDAALQEVAAHGPFLMPAQVRESGPFQGWQPQWIGEEPPLGSSGRTAAVSFYLAMMTAECLALTGHTGVILVEGPLSTNSAYCRMLAAATDCRVRAYQSATGTSLGAALLVVGQADAVQPEQVAHDVCPKDQGPFVRFVTTWRQELAQRQAGPGN